MIRLHSENRDYGGRLFFHPADPEMLRRSHVVFHRSTNSPGLVMCLGEGQWDSGGNMKSKEKSKPQRSLLSKDLAAASQDVARVQSILSKLQGLYPSHAASILRAALALLEGEVLTSESSRS